MGITRFSLHPTHLPLLSVLRTPLSALVALFVPGHASPSRVLDVDHNHNKKIVRPTAHKAPVSHKNQPARTAASRLFTKPCINAARASSSRPSTGRLRIVREFEAGVGPSCAGRMVISGRMADVCAELERMAQTEAAQTTLLSL